MVVPGEAGSGFVERVLGRLGVRASGAMPPAGPVQVLIRPEQYTARPAAGVEAHVTGHSYYGADTVLRMALADAGRTRVSAKTFDQEPPAAGERVAS